MASDQEGARPLMLRRMVAGDLDDVVENELRAYEFPWSRLVFSDCLARTDHECWVLEEGDRVIGHGILSIGAQEGHLLNLCIRRDRQGEGHGRALGLHVLARARARGAGMIFLEVRPTNRIALALYRSLGFREIGRRRDYYPAATGHEDAVVLALAEPASLSVERALARH